MIKYQTLNAVFILQWKLDISDMRFWALDPAFYAYGCRDTSKIIYQTLGTLFNIRRLVNISEMRFQALGLAFHAHGLID